MYNVQGIRKAGLLCQHSVEHNRSLKALSMMLA